MAAPVIGLAPTSPLMTDGATSVTPVSVRIANVAADPRATGARDAAAAPSRGEVSVAALSFPSAAPHPIAIAANSRALNLGHDVLIIDRAFISSLFTEYTVEETPSETSAPSHGLAREFWFGCRRRNCVRDAVPCTTRAAENHSCCALHACNASQLHPNASAFRAHPARTPAAQPVYAVTLTSTRGLRTLACSRSALEPAVGKFTGPVGRANTPQISNDYPETELVSSRESLSGAIG